MGLRYPKKLNAGNALHAKYLGVYEIELEAVWKHLATRAFQTVIDVGAAEGYLVVGSALLFPNATVHGFEQTDHDRHAIGILAEHNSVGMRVRMHGFCDQTTLSEVLRQALPDVLVIVDIEGGEKTLLDPGAIPALKTATLLVETHDFKLPGCEQLIRDRFASTHRISSIQSRARLKIDLPLRIPSILVKWFLHASSDFRSGDQVWLFLEPLN
jgi:hypothetical protein